jgi:5'-nucleotidase
MTDTGLLDWESFNNYLSANASGAGLAPDFRRAGVRVEGLPAEPVEGSALTLNVSSLNIPSLGAPANTSLEAFLGGSSLGQFAVTDGAATAAITLPAGVTGDQVLTLVAQPTGTIATVPVKIKTDGSTAPVPVLKLSVTSVEAGKPFTLSLSGAQPGLVVTVELHSDVVELAKGTVGADGTYEAKVTIPANTPAGTHNLVVYGAGLNLTQPLTVTAPQSDPDPTDPGGSGTLPVTGASGLPALLGVALGAIAAGVGLVARRRRSIS